MRGPLMRLRSPHDREIFRLALPALGALAAEPLYVLADTAIVGHLGRPQIAALGLAGTVLSGAFTIFNFLTYGTTAVVARASGAGQQERAARLAAQALWVSLAIGVALLGVCEAAAWPLLRLLGAHGQSGHYALTYFRIAAIGLPAALVALAGQGYLRGVSNLRRPLEIVVAANVVNLVLELLFVYGFHWGIAGSAAGTAIAQAGMGIAFVVELLRPHADSKRPSLREMAPMVRVGRSRSSSSRTSPTSCSSCCSCTASTGESPARLRERRSRRRAWASRSSSSFCARMPTPSARRCARWRRWCASADRSSCARRLSTRRSSRRLPCARGWATHRSAPIRSAASSSSSSRSCSTRLRSRGR